MSITFHCPGAVFHTDGKGLWSKRHGAITITKIEVDISELRVYFDPISWRTEIDGLIYTDPRFGRHLRDFVSDLVGFVVDKNDLDYSEQGMQGDAYVSFDISKELAKTLEERT